MRDIERLKATLEGLGAPRTEAEHKYREDLVKRIDSLHEQLYNMDLVMWRTRNWHAPPRFDAYPTAG